MLHECVSEVQGLSYSCWVNDSLRQSEEWSRVICEATKREARVTSLVAMATHLLLTTASSLGWCWGLSDVEEARDIEGGRRRGSKRQREGGWDEPCILTVSHHVTQNCQNMQQHLVFRSGFSNFTSFPTLPHWHLSKHTHTTLWE